MAGTPLAVRRLRTAERLGRRRVPLARILLRLDDGRQTTLHVASYDRDSVTPRLIVLDRPERLIDWTTRHGVRHAIVGGFFSRPAYRPLGELWIAGQLRASLPFHAPYAAVRGCVSFEDERVRIARRDELAGRPRGDLLQAGPLLVRGGRLAGRGGRDPEGFSAGSDQFDSDITQGRYPRAALAVTSTRVLAVACDGRTGHDAGMTLAELGRALIELGAIDALNLDGGGSASLVHNGQLRNRPREEHGIDLLGGRPIVTAIVFDG